MSKEGHIGAISHYKGPLRFWAFSLLLRLCWVLMHTYSNRNPLLVLGHIAGGHGSLEGSVTWFLENTLKADRGRIYQRYEDESVCADDNEAFSPGNMTGNETLADGQQGDPETTLQPGGPRFDANWMNLRMMSKLVWHRDGVQLLNMDLQIMNKMENMAYPSYLHNCSHLSCTWRLMQTRQCLRYLTEFLQFFESVSEPFHPHIYLKRSFRLYSFALDYNNGNTISIMRLYK